MHRSLTDYFITLGRSLVSLKTKKQTTVSRSSVEAEYRAMVATTSDLIWIRSFLASLRVFVTLPMHLSCDNQAALHIAKNPMFYERTKHIEIDYHLIRERLLSGELVANYLPSKYKLADIFIKALGTQQFAFLQSKLGIVKLGIVNPHAPTWGGVIRLRNIA